MGLASLFKAAGEKLPGHDETDKIIKMSAFVPNDVDFQRTRLNRIREQPTPSPLMSQPKP